MSFVSSSTAKSEINVTPLIDVLLVLLIIFMVISPETPKGLDAEVPSPAQNPAALTPPEPILVKVTSGENGAKPAYFLNETLIPQEEMGARLTTLLTVRADRSLFIQADESLEFESVAAVIDEAKRAGASTIGILTPRNLK